MPVIRVDTALEAQPLFEEVCRWAARLGMRFQGLPIRVRLVARNNCRPGHRGTTIHRRLWRGRKLIKNRIEAVEVVRGLVPLEFQGVVAHELGHVWLAVHRVQLPAELEEGFCEWIAHRFYTDVGTAEARQYALEIETNPDPRYGGAFRQIRALLGPGGLERVLRDRRVPPAAWASERRT